MKTKELLETYEGKEVWTDNFDPEGRICVSVYNGQIWSEGKIIVPKPTKRQAYLLQDDFCRQEYGTTDIKKIIKMEGFGHLLGDEQ